MTSLENFARAVLKIMERDQYWDDDTIDDIGSAASEYGFSTLDEQGHFKAVIPGKSKRYTVRFGFVDNDNNIEVDVLADTESDAKIRATETFYRAVKIVAVVEQED